MIRGVHDFFFLKHLTSCISILLYSIAVEPGSFLIGTERLMDVKLTSKRVLDKTTFYF